MKRQILTIFSLCMLLATIALPVFAQDATCNLTVDEYRDAGLEAFDTQDYDEAIAGFICVTQLDPTDAIAFNNLGFFYGVVGEDELAFENYAIAEELDPTYALTFSNRADLHFSQRNYEAAIADFETAISLNPDGLNAFLYNEWGLALYFTGNSAAALEKYNAAVELSPDYATAFSNRGYAYQDLSQPRLALADYEQALRLDPENADAHLGLGDVNYRLGRVQASFDAYQTYINLTGSTLERVANQMAELDSYINPTPIECPADSDFDSLLSAGNSALQNGTFDLAINLFGCAIELDPQNPAGYNNRGFANLERNTFDLAIPDLDRAIELDPEFQIAYHNRGRVYYSLDQLDTAIADFKQSIALDNNLSNESFVTLGLLYTEIPDYEAALPYLIAGANSFTGNPDALANLAFSYYQLERYEESFLAFEQLAVSVNRDNFPAHIESMAQEVEAITGGTISSSKIACEMIVTGGTSSMARQFKEEGADALRSGDLDTAAEKFECAIEFNPFDSFAYNNLALTQFQSDDIESALENYAKSLELNPWEAQTYSNRGYLYNATAEHNLAALDFDTAIKLDPEHLNAYYGRAEMHVALENWAAAKTDLDTVVELLGDNTIPSVITDLMEQIESNLTD